MKSSAHRRRWMLLGAKITFAAALVGWLVYQLQGQSLFSRLIDGPKNWGALATAQLCVVAAFSTNILRWFVLVRALDLDFRLADAFRLGSLGFLLNQVAPGSVGGDLFKAAFIAHEQPGRRTAAVATVAVDRLVGLFAMMLVASTGSSLAGGAAKSNIAFATLNWIVSLLALVGAVVLVAFLTIQWDYDALRIRSVRLPMVGPTVARLIEAGAAYRRRGSSLLAAVFIACAAHSLLVLSFWMISRGIPVLSPPLADMMLVGPMGLVAGAIPLTPSGYGTFEAAMNELFKAVGAAEGDGLLVALTYRVTTYVAASIGGVYYLSARKNIQKVMHEAEELAEQLEAEQLDAEQLEAEPLEAEKPGGTGENGLS